jgi:hypothetical protein
VSVRLRPQPLLALVACVALVAPGCGEEVAEAADFTCGQMRADGDRYREQARLMVDREGWRRRTLTQSDADRSVELRLRRACRGAGDGYRPYRATRDAIRPGAPLD